MQGELENHRISRLRALFICRTGYFSLDDRLLTMKLLPFDAELFPPSSLTTATRIMAFPTASSTPNRRPALLRLHRADEPCFFGLPFVLTCCGSSTSSSPLNPRTSLTSTLFSLSK